MTLTPACIVVQAAVREAYADRFGQRGMCWHGAVVTLPDDDGQPPRHVTVHDVLYTQASPDAFTALSVVETLLAFVHRQWPHVSKAVLQADLSDCYSSSLFIGTVAACV